MCTGIPKTRATGICRLKNPLELADMREKVKGKSKKATSKTLSGLQMFPTKIFRQGRWPTESGPLALSDKLKFVGHFFAFYFYLVPVRRCWWRAAIRLRRAAPAARDS